MQRRRFALVAACVAALTVLGLGSAAPASATVGTKPASWTPSIGPNSTVWKMQQCGSTMFAVGSFTQVSQNGHRYTRTNAFSFNAKTGALTSWNPQLDGPVYALALSSNCAIAYIGGSFKHVGADAATNIAAVSTKSGRLYTPFAHNANGTVHSLIFVNKNTQLLAGGYFTKINSSAANYYVSLNRLTGLKTDYLKASISGKVANAYQGYTMVWNQQLSRSGKALLVEGDFTVVGGHKHSQIAELMITPTEARVSSWTNTTINDTLCSDTIPFYIRGAAFSPDQKTIYIATTGNTGSSPYCDAVSAFENTSKAKVKWVNKTGHDSLYTVAAGKSDVYVGGHERWANNPHGYDTCGTGCVSREGVGAINAKSGMASAWNPGRSRGHGADDMLITSAGLWVASDTFFSANKCGGQYHPGICFFPGAA